MTDINHLKKLIIIASFAVTGCVSVPDISTDSDIIISGDNLGSAKPARMPALPNSLAIRREKLPEIVDTSPAGLQRDAIETDIAYNAAAFQVNALISLWQCVMVRINENKSSDDCLKN